MLFRSIFGMFKVPASQPTSIAPGKDMDVTKQNPPTDLTIFVKRAKIIKLIYKGGELCLVQNADAKMKINLRKPAVFPKFVFGNGATSI